MHVVVEEAKKFTVIYYLFAFCCDICSVIELLEMVGNWRGQISMGSNAIKIGCDIGGGDGSKLSVQVSKKGKMFAFMKIGNMMFNSGHETYQ